MNLVAEYIKDLKLEGIKFQFQLCSPHETIQHHEFLGNFDFNELHSVVALDIFKEVVSGLTLASSYEEIHKLMGGWDKRRITLQYEGYYYDPKRKTEAWCHVMIKRILRKRHKDLYKQIYGK